MNFSQLTSSGLFDAIVEVVRDETQARVVLESIGYPRAGRPKYPRGDDWQPFWTAICTSIEDGRLSSGRDLLPLVQAVARQYPQHPLLRAYASGGAGPPPKEADATKVKLGGRRGTDGDRTLIEPDVSCLRELYLDPKASPPARLRTDAALAGIAWESIPAALDDKRFLDRALEQLQERGRVHEMLVVASLSWPNNPKLRAAVLTIAEQFDSPEAAAPHVWHGLKKQDRKRLAEIWDNLRGAPSGVTIPVSKDKMLLDFLMGSFGQAEFERILTLNDLSVIANAVNKSVGPAEYFFAVLQELKRQGLINGAFFGLLKEVRPAKKAQVVKLEAFWSADG